MKVFVALPKLMGTVTEPLLFALKILPMNKIQDFGLGQKKVNEAHHKAHES